MTIFNPKELFVSYKEFKQINPKKWWWPGMTITLIVCVWVGVLLMMQSVKVTAVSNAQSAIKLHQEETLGQITKFVDKINLISQFVEYEHEEGVKTEELSQFTKKILHSTSQSWDVSFVSKDSIVVNSTNPKKVGANLALDTPRYSAKWSVVKTIHHPLYPLPTIHFVRKVESKLTPEVVAQIVSISENDLLFEGRFMLEQGVTALLSTRGDLLVSNGVLALKNVDDLYTNLNAVDELTELSSKFFMNNQTHIVAWALPENIPLILITGFSKEDLYAEYLSMKKTYIISGILSTIVLTILGFLATMMYCKLIQQQLKKQELEFAYRSATECAMDGFYILNAIYDQNNAVIDFIVQDCNRRGASMLGLNKQKLIGSVLSDLVSYDLFQRLTKKYISTMSIGVPPPPDEFQIDSLKPAELRGKWVSHRCSYHKMGVAVTLRDITEEKANLHILTFNAEHDAVTSLPNRTWLLNHMPRYLEELKHKQEIAYFLFVDLDRFKYVNDTHGHEVGDILLREVGARLKNTLRTGDIVTRIGGDEFIIAIYNNARLVNIEEVCSRLITEMHKPFDIQNIDIQIGASIGVSIFPKHADNLTDIMKQADEAMYDVKKSSKGAYKIWDI